MLLITLLLALAHAKPIPPASILLALDCGSDLQTKSSYSKTFSPDAFYSSNTLTNDSQLQIFKTKQKILYT